MGSDVPPPPDGVEGFDAPPPPDGVEGLDAPPSTDGVVGSDALPSTPNEQGPDFSTQASPPDADVSSLPEEVAEFDSGLDLDPTDELDVPAVAEGAGTADLFAEEPPELQDSPPAAVKSKEEVTPQDGIPTEEPSSGSQSESAHANAPRRSRKPALLALALAVGVVAWALTQTGSDGDTEAGNSEVANFADEEAPATTTSELSAEVPSTTTAGPNEEVTTTSVSESNEGVPTTTIDEADSSPTATTGVPDTPAPTGTSDGVGTGSTKSITWSSPDLPTRLLVGQQFPWSFSIVSVGAPIGGWETPRGLTCDPLPRATPGNTTTYEFSWEGTCEGTRGGNFSGFFQTTQWGCAVCVVDGPYPYSFDVIDPQPPTFSHSAFVECDFVRVEYQIDAPTYDGLIGWYAAIEWGDSPEGLGNDYPISPTSGSIQIPIESGVSQIYVGMLLEHDGPPGENVYQAGSYVYVSNDPVENGCEPAPTTTTTEPAPTTTTTEPAPTTTTTEPAG